MNRTLTRIVVFAFSTLLLSAGAPAQDEGPPGGFGGPPRGGPGGPGGPMGQQRKLVKQFDRNGDGRLDRAERDAARAAMKAEGNGQRGFGPPPGFGGEEQGTPEPGPKVSPADVKPVSEAVSLYDLGVLRTIFIDFERPDWEDELGDFAHTDVDLPATLTVDGRKYPNVGIHFRGASSLFMVHAGFKRSLNLAVDFVDPQQRVLGYKTLNLLNAHEDSTMMHTALASYLFRQYIPAPKANFVRVVINGESWGVYTNAQQFDSQFISENFPGKKGTRWKVPGSPMARGGLEYLGEDVAEYRRHYDIKTEDKDEAWKPFITLCKTLNETPPEQLEAALQPMLDIDRALKFLALEIAMVNNDGYWVRSSDYAIYRDHAGVFHIVPHDMNEVFSANAEMGPGPGGGPGFGPGRPGGPPGMGGGARGSGLKLDPLVGLADRAKPLRSRLLAVPALRERYLRYVRKIATQSLDWKNLGPVVRQLRTLIEKEVQADTRKLGTFTMFTKSLDESPPIDTKPSNRVPSSNLKAFADGRRQFLLDFPAIKQLGPDPQEKRER